MDRKIIDEKVFEELCKRLMIESDEERALFYQGYTLGYLDGQLNVIKGRRPSPSIPDAETR